MVSILSPTRAFQMGPPQLGSQLPSEEIQIGEPDRSSARRISLRALAQAHSIWAKDGSKCPYIANYKEHYF